MDLTVGVFLLLPLLSVLLLPWAAKLHRRAADLLAVLTGLVLAGSAVWLIPLTGGQVKGFEWMGIHLSVDGLSLLFLVLINSVAFFCLLYSVDYIEHYGGRAKFYALILLMVLGLNGVVLVQDLFSLYLFLEVASIASYVLVAYNLKFDGVESALKYLLLSAVATGLVLVGIALIYASIGDLGFAEIRKQLAAGSGAREIFLLAGALFVTGFGLKAAAMPFHAWLPDAHPSAPAPISAMLSGVVIKVAGIYALVRVLMDLYPANLNQKVLQVLLILGLVSMIAGAVIAYFQTDLKRMLAYSSISQIGYILVGLGTGHFIGIMGALFHVFNHGFFKSLLFLNSGAIQFRTGTRDINEMGGLEARMKVTSTTGIFGTLSIAGIPPFNGFWSKLFIILGAVSAGMYTVAVLTAVLSIFTLGYFLLIQRKVFFGKLNLKWQDLKEAPLTMCLSMIFQAALCLLIGVFFSQVMTNLIEPAAKTIIGGK